jgi:hypothetical protein
MKLFETEMKLKFWELKQFDFNEREMLKVLIKLDTNFGHFE